MLAAMPSQVWTRMAVFTVVAEDALVVVAKGALPWLSIEPT